MSLERQIGHFIEMKLLDARDVTGDPLAEGALDSLAIEQLIVFLEDRFGIQFSDDELVAERFASISTVASLVREKRRTRAGKPDTRPTAS